MFLSFRHPQTRRSHVSSIRMLPSRQNVRGPICPYRILLHQYRNPVQTTDSQYGNELGKYMRFSVIILNTRTLKHTTNIIKKRKKSLAMLWGHRVHPGVHCLLGTRQWSNFSGHFGQMRHLPFSPCMLRLQMTELKNIHKSCVPFVLKSKDKHQCSVCLSSFTLSAPLHCQYF